MQKNKYITDLMIEKLNYAFYHESTNSIVYDVISSYLNVLGFENLSKFWGDWSQEEKKHSIWVKEFLQDLNIPLSKGQLENFEYDLSTSLTEFVNVTLQREDLTTNLYNELLDIALDLEDNSSLLIMFLHKMQNEQLEETSKALTIKDKILNIGDNRALLQIFDNTFEG